MKKIISFSGSFCFYGYITVLLLSAIGSSTSHEPDVWFFAFLTFPFGLYGLVVMGFRLLSKKLDAYDASHPKSDIELFEAWQKRKNDKE